MLSGAGDEASAPNALSVQLIPKSSDAQLAVFIDWSSIFPRKRTLLLSSALSQQQKTQQQQPRTALCHRHSSIGHANFQDLRAHLGELALLSGTTPSAVGTV